MNKPKRYTMKQIWPFIYGAIIVFFIILCVKGTFLLWLSFTVILGLVLLFDNEKTDSDDQPMKPF